MPKKKYISYCPVWWWQRRLLFTIKWNILYIIYFGFETLSGFCFADWIWRVDRRLNVCPKWGKTQELAFFCSHAERHGLHTAHTAPRLSIYQIQKYPCAVCAVLFLSVYMYQHYKCWLLQRRPVETCRSRLKDWEMRMLRKASRGGEKDEKIWQTTGKWEKAEQRSSCANCCGGFLSHRAAGAESGWSTGECWTRWSCNFLSVVCVGFAPAERHPETQLLTLSEAQAS